MDTLKKKLNATCDYCMSDETLDRFFKLTSEVRLKNQESLIPYGKLDSNIYVVKEGIIKLYYLDSIGDKTFAFATAGDMIICYCSYFMGTPAIFNYESIGDSVVMKVPKEKFDELISQSNDFKSWLLRISLGQLWCWENKWTRINGSAKERFETFMEDCIKNRPELLQKVPSKVIASYIGIIPSSLSRLKRQLRPKFGKITRGDTV